jgi:hypothetical protein
MIQCKLWNFSFYQFTIATKIANGYFLWLCQKEPFDLDDGSQMPMISNLAFHLTKVDKYSFHYTNNILFLAATKLQFNKVNFKLVYLFKFKFNGRIWLNFLCIKEHNFSLLSWTWGLVEIDEISSVKVATVLIALLTSGSGLVECDAFSKLYFHW